jgi:hypothetical protein
MFPAVGKVSYRASSILFAFKYACGSVNILQDCTLQITPLSDFDMDKESPLLSDDRTLKFTS